LVESSQAKFRAMRRYFTLNRISFIRDNRIISKKKIFACTYSESHRFKPFCKSASRQNNHLFQWYVTGGLVFLDYINFLTDNIWIPEFFPTNYFVIYSRDRLQPHDFLCNAIQITM
jgi:hypothetical protein